MFPLKSKSSHKFRVFVVFFVLIAILLPQEQASAQVSQALCGVLPGCQTVQAAMSTVYSLLPSAETLGCIAGSVTPMGLIAGSICLVNAVVLSIVPYIAVGFDAILYFDANIFQVQFIQNLWVFMKNFANMFFILIMLIIAFSAIFDLQKYNWKNLLVRLIIIALLVNFSFLLVVTVHDISNVITMAFLGAIMGNGQNQTPSAWLMNGFGVQKGSTDWLHALTTFGRSLIQTASGIKIISQLIESVLLILILFTFLTMLVMYIIRIPILWAIAIFAPVAFLAAILPSTRKQFDSWLQYLLSWTFFAPAHMLILAIIIALMRQKDAILAISPIQLGGNSLATIAGQVTFSLLNVNDIFFYVLTLALLWFGLAAAKKAGDFSATGVTGAIDKIQGGIKRISQYSAVSKGVKDTYGRVKEEGLPGKASWLYGGAAGQQRKAAAVGRLLQRGMGYSVTESERKRIAEEEKKLRIAIEKMTDQEQEIYLKEKMRNGNEFERGAAGNLLDKEKKLSSDEQIQHYYDLGGDTSQTARDFMKNVDYTKWDPESRRRFHNQINDARVKGKILIDSAQVGDFVNMKKEELDQLATTFSTEAEKMKFLDNVGLSISKRDDENPRELKNKIAEQLNQDEAIQQLRQEEQAAKSLATTSKVAVDHSLKNAKEALARQYEQGSITMVDLEKREQELDSQAQQRRQEFENQMTKTLREVGTKIKERQDEVGDFVAMNTNQVFQTEFQNRLVKDATGKVLVNTRDAWKAFNLRLNKVRNDQSLDKMMKKLTDEMNLRAEGKKPADKKDKDTESKKEAAPPKIEPPKNNPPTI